MKFMSQNKFIIASLQVVFLGLLFVGQVQATGIHNIIYWDAYEEEAEQLAQISGNSEFQVKLYPISELFRIQDDTLQTVQPPAREDVDYTGYWQGLIDQGLTTGIPTALMFAMNCNTDASFQNGLKTLKLYNTSHLTIFGNPMEIPPSSIIAPAEGENANGSWHNKIVYNTDPKLNNAQRGHPTDFYYSLEYDESGVPVDYVPRISVSRIPVVVEDFASQVITLNVDKTYKSASIVKATAPSVGVITSEQYTNDSLYLDIKIGSSTFPYYQQIIGHTGTLNDGGIKIIASEYESQTRQVADVTDYPYIINTGGAERDGSYVYFDASTGQNMVEAFDQLSTGPTKTLLSEAKGGTTLHSLFDASAQLELPTASNEVKVEASGSDEEILDFNNSDPATNINTFESNINDGTWSVVLVVTSGTLEGSIFAVQNFDQTDNSFTLDTSASDPVPTTIIDNPLQGATIAIYNMTDMRDYLRGLDGGAGIDGTVKYALPSIYVNDDGDSQLQDVGYIYNLKASAQNVARKFGVWSQYNDTFDVNDGGKVDYFQKAAFVSSVLDNRWEFFSETDILEKINFRDGSDSTVPSLFNGFNITKIFQTNNDSTNGIRLLSTAAGGGSTFTSSSNIVGTLLSVNGPVMVAETDEFGRLEFEFTGPDTAGAFSVESKFYYLDDENADNDDVLFLQDRVNYFPGTTAGANFTLFFTERPQIITNSTSDNTTFVLSMLDSQGQLVTTSQASVNIFLFADTQGNLIVNGAVHATDNITTNLVNGEVSVVVQGQNDMDLLATVPGEPEVFGDTAEVFAIQDLTTVKENMRRLRLTKAQPIEPLDITTNDNVRLAYQVLNNNDRPVAEKRRVVIQLTAGRNQAGIDALHEKGLIYGSDSWDDDLLGHGETTFNGSDFATNSTGNATLPFVVSSGFAGMYLNYNRSATSGFAGYGAAGTLSTFHTGATDFTGFIGYIGFSYWGVEVYQKGSWDKGEYLTDSDDFLNNRHLLAFETLKQYPNASQPSLGSIYYQGVQAYLQRMVDEHDSVEDIQDAAEQYLGILEIWQLCGMSGLRIPNHIRFPEKSGLADEVPIPSLSLTSDDLRQSPSFDRFESYVVEVPADTDSSTVTFEVTNHEDMVDYDPNIQYRYTLVTVAHDQPVFDLDQSQARITELDFYPDVNVADIYESTTSSSNQITFTFSGNFAGNSAGNIARRGPSLYMLRVEAQEKARTGNGVTESQKSANFTKEKRLFFRVVNEFVAEDDTQFLIVNNTDQDPFRQDNTLFSNRAPNVAIRYYEDALDNYNYTKGRVNVEITSNNQASITVEATDPDLMHWESRVVVGDKLRFSLGDVDTSYSPWLRVTSVDSDGETITVDNDDDDPVGITSLSNINYIIQRAYTFGHAIVDYTVATTDGVIVPSNDGTVQISIPSSIVDGFDDCVHEGDFFKFLDERAYAKIDDITYNGVSGGRAIYTLTLEDPYPVMNVWTYYSNNEQWGGFSKLSLVADGSYTGSYAIYPENPNDTTKPSYLYQTWNVNSYNTSNALGVGVHGDIKESVLELFDDGDTDGIRHKAVIWANDAGYGVIERKGNHRARAKLNGIGENDTQVWPGEELHYVSDQEEVLFSGFLGRGGRLLMSGQNLYHAATNTSTFFTERIGAVAGNTESESSVSKVGGDPVTGVYENEINIFDGQSEGSRDTIEDEATLTNVTPTSLEIQGGRSMPILYYGDPDEEDDGVIAGVRASGGSNISPYASIYLGFDYSNILYSGVKNTFYNRESEREGRNLLMKKSMDWLRDPSLTSNDRALRIVYEAEEYDGSKSSVILPKENEITVNSSLHDDAGLLTDVGVNQELAFVAQNGKLYGRTLYTWEVVENKNGSYLIQDPNEPDNDDWHKVIFRTGSQAGDDYQIKVTSPDEGQVLITVETEDAPLFLLLDENRSDNLIIDDRMIYDPDETVDFFAFGGSGLGSYEFFVRDGGVDFAQKSFLTVGQRSVTYNVPDSVTKLEDEVTVSIEVQSGSQVATSSITFLPPVEISNPTDNFVVRNGASRTIYAFGGSSDDYMAVVSDANILTATSVEDTNNVILSVTTGANLSTDPSDPSIVGLTIRDSIFYDSSDNIDVRVYGAPSFEHGSISNDGSGYVASDTEFEQITDGKKVFIPTDGLIPLRLGGGTGKYTVTVTAVTNNISSTNILTASGSDYDVGDGVSVTYSTTSPLTLNAGNTTGTVSLKVVTEGGSQSTVNFALVSPIDISVNGSLYSTSSTLRVKPGANIQLSAANGFEPYSWSFSPNNLGGFGSTSSSGNATSYTSSEEENLFFIASTTVNSGKITVEDEQGNFGLLDINITTIEELKFRADSDDLMSTFNLTESTQGFPYTFTGGLASYTIRLTAEDSDIRISRNNSFSNGGQQVTLTAADALTDDTTGETYYRFYFFPRDPEDNVMISITDAENGVLSSQEINISKATGSVSASSGSTNFASADSGGGGGGCLLR